MTISPSLKRELSKDLNTVLRPFFCSEESCRLFVRSIVKEVVTGKGKGQVSAYIDVPRGCSHPIDWWGDLENNKWRMTP